MKEESYYFSQQLNLLFATVARPDGKPFTQDEVVQGCQGLLTRVYLWKLRTGKAKNPSFAIACALADFFGVSVAYFQMPNKRHEEVERAMQNPLIQKMNEYAARLDNQALHAILHIMETMDAYKQKYLD
jgi:transcriptional regulator with XRE-family HTH domain